MTDEYLGSTKTDVAAIYGEANWGSVFSTIETPEEELDLISEGTRECFYYSMDGYC